MFTVQIGHYREINKGALKAFFTFSVEEFGLSISDCKHFEKDGQEWFNFPSKEVIKNDAKEYFPLANTINNDVGNKLRELVLKELKKKNEKATESTGSNRQKEKVPSESSFGWDKPPF